MNIRLHIDRLVLDGVPPGVGGARRFQASMEAELARLLTEGGLGQSLLSGGAIPQLRVGPVQADAYGNPSRLGAGVARAVYGGLKNPEGA